MMWRRHWPNLIALLDYPPETRDGLDTANAIESLNGVIQKTGQKTKTLSQRYGVT